MKKAIALRSQDPKLDELLGGLDKLREETVEQLDYLQKKAKQIAEKADEAKKAHWKIVEAYLKEAGLLEGYDPKKDSISFDEAGAVYLIKDCKKDGADMSLADVLNRVFGR